MEKYKNLEEIIKLCEEELDNNDENVVATLDLIDLKELRNLIKTYKEKDKDNNDLRRLYRRTAIKLKENDKEELADYFLAQINEVPTFTVEDDIDYYSEYHKLKEKNKTYLKQLNGAFSRGFIHKDKIKEIRDKAEVMDYYTLPDVIEDLNELLGGE